uniref:Ribonuclease H protein At1g65750 family n=1 Tax=Cajanus cajan TaxID=3821 RepID=A0A151S4L7_CAJCA|nr:Putative ribonuclease H protein At1g65750 family [Cajanus cajan]
MNTRLFHKVISWKRRKNGLSGIRLSEEWVQEPNQVKKEVNSFFKSKFRDEEWVRPKLDGVAFHGISVEQNTRLTVRFQEDKVKQEIWECDGSKCLGPDRFNFNFLAPWKGKFLSMTTRTCLINSNLTSLPLYFLSFYKMLKQVVRNIVKIQRVFLWGAKEGERKIPWVSWKKICQDKIKGGLGVKNIEMFNDALLSKW